MCLLPGTADHTFMQHGKLVHKLRVSFKNSPLRVLFLFLFLFLFFRVFAFNLLDFYVIVQKPGCLQSKIMFYVSAVRHKRFENRLGNKLFNLQHGIIILGVYILTKENLFDAENNTYREKNSRFRLQVIDFQFL